MRYAYVDVAYFYSCQFSMQKIDIVNYNNVQLRTNEAALLPSDVIKRNLFINEFKKSSSVHGLEVQVAPGVSTLMYSIPAVQCAALLNMEFIHLCITPISTVLALGSAHSSTPNMGNGVIGAETTIHGIKHLDMKLEMLLLAHTTPSIAREDGTTPR